MTRAIWAHLGYLMTMKNDKRNRRLTENLLSTRDTGGDFLTEFATEVVIPCGVALVGAVLGLLTFFL